MTRLTSLRGCVGLFLLGAALGVAPAAQAQLVPGTGNLLNFDDLEDPNWGYVHNFPKSSKEEDETIRYPLGASNNRMWSESPKRGSPDVVRRCETPPGGLAGSTGALYMRTRDSGIPGHPGHKQAQDDFILSARPCGVGYSPNYVVRVYLPEFAAWEQRQGVSFGIRAGLQGMMTKDKPASFGKRLFRGKRTESVTEMEPYYPGFFIAYNPVAANPAYKENHAQILIRSDGNGHEVPGPKITQTGWWTFGMSVTPDSRCHYYAHPGIADLTAKDHIYSSLPYGIKGDYFNTIFFNVCSADDGSSWSTPWIIDDPRVYYSGQAMIKPAEAPQQAQQQQPVKTAQAPTGQPTAQNASMTKETPAPSLPAPTDAPASLPQTPAAIPLAPPEATPVAPSVGVPKSSAPLAPLPSASTTPVNVPVPPSAPPALLTTGPAVSMKAAQPLIIPASKPHEEKSTPVAAGPMLVLPATPAAVIVPSAPAPVVSATLSAPSPQPATVLKANPFDDSRKPNAPVAKVKTPAPAVASRPAPLTVTPPQEEPPLVLPEPGDASTTVDPAPVPLPPSE